MWLAHLSFQIRRVGEEWGEGSIVNSAGFSCSSSKSSCLDSVQLLVIISFLVTVPRSVPFLVIVLIPVPFLGAVLAPFQVLVLFQCQFQFHF